MVAAVSLRTQGKGDQPSLSCTLVLLVFFFYSLKKIFNNCKLFQKGKVKVFWLLKTASALGLFVVLALVLPKVRMEMYSEPLRDILTPIAPLSSGLRPALRYCFHLSPLPLTYCTAATSISSSRASEMRLADGWPRQDLSWLVLFFSSIVLASEWPVCLWCTSLRCREIITVWLCTYYARMTPTWLNLSLMTYCSCRSPFNSI